MLLKHSVCTVPEVLSEALLNAAVRRFWETGFDRMDDYIDHLKNGEKT